MPQSDQGTGYCCLNGRKCWGLHYIQDTNVVYIPRFQRLPHKIATEFAKKKCMSDNIRNKAIFEIKIAKIAQKRCTMGMFLLTLQNIPVSLPFYIN